MTVLHLAFALGSLLVVLIADEQGLSWFLGKRIRLPLRRVRVLHTLVSLGIAGLLLTGGLLFIDRSTYLLSDSVFLVKMVFVSALVINGFFIDRIMRIATETPFAKLTTKERARVMVSAGISGAGWIGAFLCGLVLA